MGSSEGGGLVTPCTVVQLTRGVTLPHSQRPLACHKGADTNAEKHGHCSSRRQAGPAYEWSKCHVGTLGKANARPGCTCTCAFVGQAEYMAAKSEKHELA